MELRYNKFYNFSMQQKGTLNENIRTVGEDF